MNGAVAPSRETAWQLLRDLQPTSRGVTLASLCIHLSRETGCRFGTRYSNSYTTQPEEIPDFLFWCLPRCSRQMGQLLRARIDPFSYPPKLGVRRWCISNRCMTSATASRVLSQHTRSILGQVQGARIDVVVAHPLPLSFFQRTWLV